MKKKDLVFAVSQKKAWSKLLVECLFQSETLTEVQFLSTFYIIIPTVTCYGYPK